MTTTQPECAHEQLVIVSGNNRAIVGLRCTSCRRIVMAMGYPSMVRPAILTGHEVVPLHAFKPSQAPPSPPWPVEVG